MKDLPEGGEKLDPSKVSGLRNILLILGIAGLAGSGYFAFAAGPEKAAAFSYSWLFAIFTAFTLVCGGCFWILVHNASNSSWGVAVRRIWESLANQALPLGLLAIPLLVSTSMQDHLWEWTTIHRAAKVEAAAHATPEHPADVHHALHEMAKADPHVHSLVEKYGYLNIDFWSYRFVAYFLILGFIAWKLRSYFLKQEKDGKIEHTVYAREFACIVLLPFALTLTFGAVDWLMTLDYTWFSTMWGVYIFAGCAWSSMALSILTLIYLRSKGHMLQVTSDEHFHLMGKFLLAFTIFWAYIAYSQYFLIWYANIPEETRFFYIHNTGGWRWVSILMVVGHFVAPFVVLLSQPRKKKPKAMLFVTIWVLLMHLVDMYWNVMPERGPSLWAQGLYDVGGKGSSWVPDAWIGDICAFLAVIGILGWRFIGTLGANSLYAHRDPRLLESINVHN